MVILMINLQKMKIFDQIEYRTISIYVPNFFQYDGKNNSVFVKKNHPNTFDI